jgi:NIPSNAP.
MKRGLFFSLLIGAFMTCFVFSSEAQVNDGQIQEWRIYNFKLGGSAARFDRLMTDIVLPLYKDMGVVVGCFKEISQNSPASYYYLFVYPSLDSYMKANDILLKNSAFVNAMKEDAAANRQMYFRYDSYLCRPFEAWKEITPAAGKTVFEWRKYESANIEAGTRKVQMFNQGEIAAFVESGVNPFSFGQIIAGKDLPGLIYVTHYNDMADRDASWAKFSSNPTWQSMRSDPQWANATISNNTIVFLTPLPYSPIK